MPDSTMPDSTTSTSEPYDLAQPATHTIPGADGRGLRHLLSRLRSYFFYVPLVFLYTGVFGVGSLIASLFDQDGSLQHWFARTWSKTILATIVPRVEVIGLENLPRTPTVIAANHLSALDIPLLYAELPIIFRIVAKIELFSIPVLGWHLRRSRQIAVDATNARASFRSLHRAVDAITKEHVSVVIFPEGGRSPSGAMLPFMSGPFYLAVKAKAAITPVAIIGTYEMLPMNTFHIMPRPLKLVIGEPISTEAHSLRDLDALTSEVTTAIRGLLGDHLTGALPS